MFGFSAGGGEVARFVGRHGTFNRPMLDNLATAGAMLAQFPPPCQHLLRRLP